MKLTPCALLLGLAFTCGSSAQEIPPPADPALHEQLGGLGYGEAVASSATYYSGTRPEGMSYGYHFRGYEGHGPSPAGVTEIQVIRFTEQEGADAFMLAKAPILGDYMGEQRGRYVVLVAGDTIENPERSLEILREVCRVIDATAASPL